MKWVAPCEEVGAVLQRLGLESDGGLPSPLASHIRSAPPNPTSINTVPPMSHGLKGGDYLARKLERSLRDLALKVAAGRALDALARSIRDGSLHVCVFSGHAYMGCFRA
jgi:hypothetical protein